MKRWPALAICAILPNLACGEQFMELGDYQAHYMILDTLSLESPVAEAYGLTRSRDQSILTVSVLDADGVPVEAMISGNATNLLGVSRTLSFEAIAEGDAHYSIAAFKHTEEQMRFSLRAQTPDGQVHQIRFEQKLYLGVD